jgi:hypothetical protein
MKLSDLKTTDLRGSLSVSDVFLVLSLGLETDGKTDYPLIAFHITGKIVSA